MIVLAACSSPTPTPTRRPPSTPTPTIVLPTATPLPGDTPRWLRQAVLYQVDPRSFYDSDGDGKGDLNGLTQKLDYLYSLGVTAIWLMPIFSAASAQGYAVTDHLAIASELGTQQDLITLVNEAHARNMRVILDLVADRTSNKHPFFQDAYRRPASFYSDWYLWENAAHTVYKSADANKSEPLLNTENPGVQRYLLEVARYWMDLDDDGDVTDGLDGFFSYTQFASPTFWKMLRAEVKSLHPDCLLMGYTPARTAEQIAPYYEDQFDAMLDTPLYSILLGSPDKNGEGLLNYRGTPATLNNYLEQQSYLFPPAAQIVRFAGHVNTNRILTKVRGDPARARLATALLLSLPGTPVIYYGEEIGLQGNVGATRKPMDWVAVSEQSRQADSLLEAYRRMIAQRRLYPAMAVGGFQLTEADRCEACLAYWRWDENDFYLVLINLANETQATTIDFNRVPRPVRGAGEDVLRGGRVTVPSNGRYTLTIEALGIRVLHWGKP